MAFSLRSTVPLPARCAGKWTRTDLGTLSGEYSVSANGINESGRAVGSSSSYPALYSGTMADPGTLDGEGNSQANGHIERLSGFLRGGAAVFARRRHLDLPGSRLAGTPRASSSAIRAADFAGETTSASSSGSLYPEPPRFSRSESARAIHQDRHFYPYRVHGASQ
jgi:uncharacterized membrane protein